ncbi:hypothetical protein ACFYTG_37475 [Streptomyces mirabilis]|uniref:hypothetical protein n=1 Tax=Streptomyces mirabilis TaxID=68239 RepID=UPI00368F6D34
MTPENECHKHPQPAKPGKFDSASANYGLDHSHDLRQRVTRLTFQVLDHIEESGAVVDGEANPDIELLCLLIDSGTGLRRVALERKLAAGVLEYRARRPLNGIGQS